MVGSSAIAKRELKEWQLFCEQVQSASAVNFNEGKEKQKARIQRALTDYNYFVKTYFPIYADSDCAWFHIKAANAILKDPNIFAILEWPREHAKSVHMNIMIPMWLLAHGELTGMILMGKNETDACNLLSDVQAQMQFNELYIHDFGEQYNMGSWEQGDFTTRSGIRFLALGRDQSPRGARKNEKRPNYAVGDDIDDDELVLNQQRVKKIVKRILGALYFALSIKGARVIIGGNRIHPQSTLAHLVGDLKPNMPKRKAIFHLKVCAIENGEPAWKERYSLEELTRKMEKAGPLISKVEFFHEHHIEGSVFKDRYFQWKKLPKLCDYTMIIGYFDPSFEDKPTSDYKAIRVWGLHIPGQGTPQFHCLKSYVRRSELSEAFMWMINYERSLPEGVKPVWYVEEQFFNRPIRDALQEVCKISGYQLHVITDTRTKENKYTRMIRMEPRYSFGQVYYNINEAHDNDMVEGNNQLKGIEPGYKGPDDAPDADEGAWHYLEQHLPDYNFTPVIGKQTQRGW